jgi:hypothetical protein
MALREVYDETAHRGQRHQGPRTSVPQLRVDGFLFPWFAQRAKTESQNRLLDCVPDQVEKIHDQFPRN